MLRKISAVALFAAALAISQTAPKPAVSSSPHAALPSWKVLPRWVKAHEDFLASDILQGRGSSTRDEGIAATYVASQFEAFGLQPAPGAKGYVQAIELEQPEPDNHAIVSASGIALDEGKDFSIAYTPGSSVTAPLQKVEFAGMKTARVNRGAAILLLNAPPLPEPLASLGPLYSSGAKLVLLANPELAARAKPAHIPPRLKGSGPALGGHAPSVLALTSDASSKLAGLTDGEQIAFSLKVNSQATRSTYNAMAFLPGSNKAAGTILITAHLDHLGIGEPVNGDKIYNGADDDASGTTAVLEIAHALAANRRTARSLLFVCFGSEELGGFGDDYFRQNPPVPLSEIVANLEFEMIGAQDPKMAKGIMLLSGWERSNLGPTLKAHGAKLGPDPYPEQHFFQRSDNYALALKGVIAHTAAGFGVPPYYHRPDDDLSHIDLAFMTEAIQSMIEPLRWLANSSFKPAWNPGQQPH